MISKMGVIYGILGEDASDKEVIHSLLRRLTGDPKLAARGRGFRGKPNLLKEGARELRSLHAGGCSRFIICADCDKNEPETVLEEINDEVIIPSGVPLACCAVVPVRMIESWLLADLDLALIRWKKHPKWRPPEVKNPESWSDPKSKLVDLSREGQVRPRYSPPTDNPLLASHLDTDRVARKCPSFVPFRAYVLA